MSIRFQFMFHWIISLRSHFGVTSISLQIHFEFTSSSIRFHPKSHVKLNKVNKLDRRPPQINS